MSTTITVQQGPNIERLTRILTGVEPLRVVSYGGGLHSTGMLVKMVEIDKNPPDMVMFADTGNELPETYAAVDFYKKWCEDRGIEFVIVKNNYGKTLGQYCTDKKIFPSRRRRDCTTKFKISPMRRYLRERFGRQAKFIKYIGYDSTEKKRAEKASAAKGVKYEILQYPLIEAGLDRLACAKILQERNLPIPQKSGCSFCPFTKKMGWVWLYFKHRALYDEAEDLENNSNDYQVYGWTLSSRPLTKLRQWIEENRAELEAQFKAMGDDMAGQKACEAILFARGINKGTGI